MSLPATFYVPLERDTLRLTGRDRQSFLQGMVSNDVASLTPGEGCYAFHLTSKGQIIADLLVLCLEDSLLLSTELGWGVALTESLEHHLVMERVKISSSTATTYFVYGTKPDEPCVFNGLGWLVYDTPPTGLTSQDETTYEGLRIEAGIPRGRIDFDEKTLAPETGQASRAMQRRDEAESERVAFEVGEEGSNRHHRFQFHVREAGPCTDDRGLVWCETQVGENELTICRVDAAVAIDIGGRHVAGTASNGASCCCEHRHVGAIDA